ncbi:MAG: TolC family protein [Rikenellaceae bacterium]
MKIKLLLCLILVSMKVDAQLALNEYRDQVLGYSLDIKKSENSVVSSIEEWNKYKTLRLPTLSLSGSFDYNMRQLNGQKQWGFAVQPQLTQTLYGGGSVNATIETYQVKSEIALCDLEYTYLEVLYAADYAYWSLYSMRRYRDAMREYVKIIESLKAVVDRRFSEGYISKSDVLMIATRLNEARYSYVVAEQSYIVALHNFNILRGASAEEFIDLKQIVVTDVMPPLRASLDVILARRPDFEAIELVKNVSEIAIRSTKATYNPTLSAGISASWMPYTPNISGKTRIDGLAFLSLSATLFHFGERRRAVAVAQASYIESKINRAILHDSIEKEEVNGWTVVIDTNAQVHTAKESLSIAGESLNISTYSYSEGQTTILDVMQAQIGWIQSYTNSIDAEFNYMVAISSYSKISAELVDFVDVVGD